MTYSEIFTNRCLSFCEALEELRHGDRARIRRADGLGAEGLRAAKLGNKVLEAQAMEAPMIIADTPKEPETKVPPEVPVLEHLDEGSPGSVPQQKPEEEKLIEEPPEQQPELVPELPTTTAGLDAEVIPLDSASEQSTEAAPALPARRGRKKKKKRAQKREMSSAYRGLSAALKRQRDAGMPPEMKISANLRPVVERKDFETFDEEAESPQPQVETHTFEDDDALTF